MIARLIDWLFPKKCGEFRSHCLHIEGIETDEVVYKKVDCKKGFTYYSTYRRWNCCRCEYSDRTRI